MFYFFFNSEGRLAESHKSVLSILSLMKETETNLEKDTMRSRNFLLANYDVLVAGADKLVSSCDDLKKILSSQDKNLTNEVDIYCKYANKKIDLIESFKSKNAVIRNSLHFLQKSAISNEGNYSQLEIKLLKLALAYYLIPDHEVEKNIKQILSWRKKSTASVQDLLTAHSLKIIKNKMDLDLSVLEIIQNSKREPAIERLIQSYYTAYKASEQSANFFKVLLFVSSLFLFGVIVYSILKLWKLANELKIANSTLEQKVNERTIQLNNEKSSMSLILSNIDQGLFTFNEQGVIEQQLSRNCLEIFAEDIRGRHIDMVLKDDVKG
jgi:hypothetical protein